MDVNAVQLYPVVTDRWGRYVRGLDRESFRVREGKTLTTDGPFAETHEQLGGFFVLDCKDLDEAIQWAAKIPTAKYGSIEVRPDWTQAV